LKANLRDWLPWIFNNGSCKLFGWFGVVVMEALLPCLADWCGHAGNLFDLVEACVMLAGHAHLWISRGSNIF
jgi:hypothetical protein